MNYPRIWDYAGKKLHMVGIGGSSMSGLAQMLLGHGFIVSGSDSQDSYALDKLRQLDIPVYAGHLPDKAEKADLLVYSAAIAPDDAERMAAQQAGIPQMERAELLGQLMEGYEHRVCVSGTHGKTTLSSMLAQVLLDLHMNPTVHIGGSLDRIGGGTYVGGKDIFVAEACEFNRSFLHMTPSLAIITNIEEDHLDCYRDIEEIEQAFCEFIDKLPGDGLSIGLADDERVMRVMRRSGRSWQSFSLEGEADFTTRDLLYDSKGCASFDALHSGELIGHVKLKVAGDFNALHALGALAAALALGGDGEEACRSLSKFEGVHRRFEHTGIVQGMQMYHDYGHNPAEMKSAVSVACMQGRRVIAVMQPHTYSRVKGLFQDFLTCTKSADVTLVTDIYAAREKDPGDIHSRMLVEGMKDHGIEAYLTPAFEDTEAWLLQHGKEGDLVLTMGCGNINLLNDLMQVHWDDKQSKTEELNGE